MSLETDVTKKNNKRLAGQSNLRRLYKCLVARLLAAKSFACVFCCTSRGSPVCHGVILLSPPPGRGVVPLCQNAQDKVGVVESRPNRLKTFSFASRVVKKHPLVTLPGNS